MANGTARIAGRRVLSPARRLTARLLLAVFLWGALFPARTEAGLWEDIYGEEAEDMIVLANLLMTEWIMEQFLLLPKEEDVTEAVQKILDQTVFPEGKVAGLIPGFRQIHYDEDHEPLADSGIVSRDLTGAINETAGDMLLRQALLAAYPGYREPGGASCINFSDAYNDRVLAWLTYAYSVLKTNNREAYGTFETQGLMKKLREASKDAYSYRQLMQAGAQTSNFASHELSRVRLDVQRQLEAETLIAVNERQERSDIQAAFGQAVREWRNQHGGNGHGY